MTKLMSQLCLTVLELFKIALKCKLAKLKNA